MKVVIDATVWIDFHSAGLVDALLRLPWDILVPDIILHDEIQGLGLGVEDVNVGELSARQVGELVELIARYSAPSRADLAALKHAMDERRVLLTGDRALSKAAKAEGVESHGTLWVLDVLVQRGILGGGEATQALGVMRRGGARLPDLQCALYVKTWKER